MKKLFLISAALFMAVTVACAQNASDGKRFIDKLVLDLEVSSGTKCDDMNPLTLGVNIGYKFIPRTYVFIHGANMFGHYDRNGTKTYINGANLGGGLAYVLIEDKDIDLELRGNVSAGLSDSWKNTSYDIGLMMKVKSGVTNINFGVSFRHINSHTAGIDSYNGAFFTIGFGI